MQTLNIKSQVIEKDGQIENLMERLAQKGEETAALSSQYLELKNYMLDQELFETKYSVTRVPLDDIAIGANVQAALAQPQVAQHKKKVNVQRRDLVFSFVQDKQLVGEFFIMLITPT